MYLSLSRVFSNERMFNIKVKEGGGGGKIRKNSVREGGKGEEDGDKKGGFVGPARDIKKAHPF
jgi:hypothetical protein